MSIDLVYVLLGAGLVGLSLWRLGTTRDAIRRVLALNVLAVGVAVLLLAEARGTDATDPVPQAFVLTEIVVLIAVTAALLALAERIESDRDD